MFLRRVKNNINKQSCTRCAILRMYFSAIFVLIVLYIVAEDKVSYLSFVNKQVGVYFVFGLGGLVLIYRVLEWYFFLREPRKSDQAS